MIELSVSKATWRTRLFSYLFATALMLICFILTSCSRHNDADTDSSDSANDGSAISSTSLKGADVAATVNGEPITVSEFYDAMQHYVPATVANFPNNPQLNQQAGLVVMQTLISNHLKMQLAKDDGVPVQQADIDGSFQDYCLQVQTQSVLPINTVLLQEGYTPDQLKQEVLAPQVAEINLLQKTVVVTPEALQTAYKADIQKYNVPSAVHIHRIVCSTQDQAKSVADALKSGQPVSNFLTDNLARDGAGGDYSDDSNIANWIRTDHADPALGTYGPQLDTAKIGDVIGPVAIGGQWWVIQIADKRPSSVLPFDQVQDLERISYVRQVASQNQGAQDVQASLIKYMQSAAIRINIPAYQILAEQLHDIHPPAQAPAPNAQSGH